MNRLVLIFVCSIIFSSCSSIFERKTLFGSSDERQIDNQTVSKAQYDELLKKYEVLQSEVNAPKKQQVTQVEGDTPSDVVENLTKATSTGYLSETVDVFNDKKKVSRTSSINENGNLANFENELLSLRKVEKLVRANRMNDAMAQLKVLEDSANKQIRVRAKYLIGEILYRQGNYDLAMQIFEEVVHDYAFSGVILSSLKKLAICSDKLKLPKKKELYFSMLHDFF